MKMHYNNEGDKLIASEPKSYNSRSHNERHSSRLEWAESSWTGYLHILCWWWMNPILSLGYKRLLTDNDLDDLPQRDKSSILLNRVHFYDWTVITAWKIIIKLFWKDFLVSGLFFFPLMIARLVQPLLIRQILLIISNKQESPTVAYLCAILLFISAIIQIFFQQLINFYSIRVGTRIRNVLTLMIYERSLSIKTVSFERITTAETI